MSRSSRRSRASARSRWWWSAGLGSVSGAIVGAVFVKSTEWFSVIVPVRFRFLFRFAGSGIGLLLVLWLLPGGFGSVLYGIRDSWLRFVARRRGIVAPTLVTDAGRVAATVGAHPGAAAAAAAEARRPSSALPLASGLLGANDAPVALAFRNVDVAYGHLQVLFGTTLEVRRGETVALLGTNGAGQVHDAPDGVGSLHAVPRQRVARRRRHQRAGAPQGRRARPRPRARRPERLRLAQRRRQPADGRVDPPPRPRRRRRRDRSACSPVPVAPRSARRTGRRAVGRSAADAHASRCRSSSSRRS